MAIGWDGEVPLPRGIDDDGITRVQPQDGRGRLYFRYGGKQFNKTIPVESDKEALRVCALIEETIQDLQRGKLATPAEADPALFILSAAKVAATPSHAEAFSGSRGPLLAPGPLRTGHESYPSSGSSLGPLNPVRW